MKPQLAYPISPIHVNQPFGANAAYYEKTFGQNGHPGIDFQAAHGQPVYAAHDGYAYALRDMHGGEGIWLYDLSGSFITIYWHMIGNTDATYPQVIPLDFQRHPVKKGDLVGYADNTGAPYESTGDHLHFGLMLAVNDNPTNTDNGTQGCIDPEPYFDGTFARNEPVATVEAQASALATEVQNIDPQSASAPQQESLAEKVVEGIEQELENL